jgi:cell division protein FtsB
MQARAVSDPKTFRITLGVAVGLLLALLGAAGVNSWRDLETARARQRQLEAEIATSEAAIERLERRIELLGSDPVTLERLAREELWMARPDEVVIVLPEAATGRPVAAVDGAGSVGQPPIDGRQ